MKKLLVILLAFFAISMPFYADDDFATTLAKAQQGDADAQCNLGLMYEKGNGVTQDYAQAVAWFRKAAEQGYARAQSNLGVMYGNGQGVTQDYAQAVAWFRKAAEQGYARAQSNLGYMYEQGNGVKQDYAQAVAWYRKAAEQGNAIAQNNLGVRYHNGQGVTQDYSQAVAWYRKAAEQGFAHAQYNLGVMYENGQGVTQNYAQAVAWYRKAAEQGYAHAQCNLGYMYESGRGVKQDYAQAVAWYRKAAEQGYARGQCNLGVMYGTGQGITQDHAQAVAWYRKAAEQGYAHGQYNLGVLYHNGYGVKQDYSMAMMWYKRAAANGHADAQKWYNELAANGYKAALPPEPPLLVLVENSLTFTDATRNNQIEANEQSHIRFRVRNMGKGPAINCEARVRLSGNTSGITVNNITLPDIAPGKEHEVTIPVNTNINTQNGKVTFAIEVHENRGFGVAPFNLTVATKVFESPFMQVTDHTITSASGMAKKMDFITLTFVLQNTQYGDAQDVKVNIKHPDNVVIMEGEPQQSFATIRSGEAKTIKVTFVANNNYTANTIPINIDIKEKYGKYAENKQIAIALNQSTSSNITIASIEDNNTPQGTIQKVILGSDVDRNIPRTSIQAPNTFVVILANENYQRVAPVPYALNDGNIFSQYCETTLGIPSKNIIKYLNASLNDMHVAIARIKNICEAYEGEASVIFYYAGHGIPDAENENASYLLPADGDGRYVATAYKLDELYQTLGALPAKSVTVLLDACFSGANRDGQMLASARGVAIKSRPGAPKGNMVVLSAAQGDQTALPNEQEKHGMFTYFLLKKLQETSGNITLGELSDYIIREVKRETAVTISPQTPCVSAAPAVANQWQNWKLQ